MEEEAIVDQIKDTPADIIVITGGEPSMYDLTKLTALIREHCVSHSFGTDSVTIQVNWLPTQHPSLSRDHLVASPLICIETNGTCALKGEIDFVCVSPKPLSYRKGDGVTYDEGTFKRANEIKLVVGWTSAEELDNDIRSFTAMANEQTQILLSPLTTFPEGELDPAAAQAAVDACKRYQNIRLSPQWHKWIKIR
jgi:organic radical activating enzyme